MIFANAEYLTVVLYVGLCVLVGNQRRALEIKHSPRSSYLELKFKEF